MNTFTLSRPPRYFPLEKGLYEVAPGLRSLGTDFGNGAQDGRVFQIDDQFPLYRKNMDECRKERLAKYVCTADFPLEYEEAVARFMARRLGAEYPEFFHWEEDKGASALHCRHTGETLRFDAKMRLLETSPKPETPYISAFDALSCQVQEDIAITSRRADKGDWLSALHLTTPSHWSAEDKIGRSFIDVHTSIPHIEKINKASASLIDAMIHKGPYVRFIWSFVTDQRLNHHPEAPPGWDPAVWKGRSFQKDHPDSPFHLRIERQVTWGLPEIESSFFTIRVSFIHGKEVWSNPKENRLLRSALASMSPASRVYKGVAHCYDDLVAWLDSAPGL